MSIKDNTRSLLVCICIITVLVISIVWFGGAQAEEKPQRGDQPTQVYLPLVAGADAGEQPDRVAEAQGEDQPVQVYLPLVAGTAADAAVEEASDVMVEETSDPTAEEMSEGLVEPGSPDQTPAFAGEFVIIWGDGKPGTDIRQELYFLFDDQGRMTELQLDPEVAKRAGGPGALYRKRVEIVGDLVGPTALKVRKIKPSKTAQTTSATVQAAVSGSQPWVTILCRFADSTGVTPQPLGYFQGLMGSNPPGMNHYFREDSYNIINLDGSPVVGWYNLPSPRADYLPGGNLNFNKAANDCTAAADAALFFPNFIGVNLIFDQDLGCCAWGGWVQLSRDGQTKSYAMTWMPPWGWLNQSVMAHEMGHGFGLPHSSGPYLATYDSQWDPMSSTWRCTPFDPVYGCVAPHTISYHKDRLAWIPASDKYRMNTNGNHALTIAQLGTTASANDYLMAEVPIGCSSRFYTVEARRFVGYEGYLPGQAVIIHEVDPTRGDRAAQVVDSDNNGNPNDAGAMWLPGETFVDAPNGISIAVTGATTTGWNVTLNRAGSGNDYEPDNRWEQAHLFAIGGTEHHEFCFDNDQDWVYFSATAGTSYRIETLNLIALTDTILCLYQNPAQSAILCDDDGGGFPNSLINFTPSTSAPYYVQAVQFDGGKASTYDLRITSTSLTNLAMNPSFETDANADGKPDTWGQNALFTRSTEVPAVNGSYVGRFSATTNANIAIFQNVSVSAGTNYTFACSTRIPDTTDTFSFKLQIQWGRADNTTISNWTLKSYTVDTNGAWNRPTGNKLAPAGAAKAQVRLVASSLKGKIYIDHCVFKPA